MVNGIIFDPQFLLCVSELFTLLRERHKTPAVTRYKAKFNVMLRRSVSQCLS